MTYCGLSPTHSWLYIWMTSSSSVRVSQRTCNIFDLIITLWVISVKDLLNEGITDSYFGVSLCYLSNGLIIFPIHIRLNGKTTEKYSKQIQEHKKLIRSSPYSPGLHLQSNFQWWPCFIVPLGKELQYRDSVWVRLKQVLLGKVVLRFPKPPEYTKSSSSY